MQALHRREFLAVSAAACLAAEPRVREFHLAPFRYDVTPPLGHSLCGGWIKPAEAVDDALEAVGFVLLGAGKPMVICAVDWTGLLNDAYSQWRDALAEAAGTTPDRVAVQCVHQHNAPFACLNTDAIVRATGSLPNVIERDFFKRCLDRGRQAVKESLSKARRITHIASSLAKVHQVAANRRVQRDEKNNVLKMRGSSCKDEALRALPEGLIDPMLKTVTFFEKDAPVAACHYYACHPMSYYGDGRISSDYVGLARKQRQKEVPGCHRLYFTGCAGNVGAGKYNDGSKPMRAELTKRIHAAIVESEKQLKPEPVGDLKWNHTAVKLPFQTMPGNDELKTVIQDAKAKTVTRDLAAYRLAWNERAGKTPIDVSALSINDISLLHLPSEVFVEYQLRAQKDHAKKFVACAAYGDGGPWYLPTKEEYPFGGYEVGVAFSTAESDGILEKAVNTVLT